MRKREAAPGALFFVLANGSDISANGVTLTNECP